MSACDRGAGRRLFLATAACGLWLPAGGAAADTLPGSGEPVAWPTVALLDGPRLGPAQWRGQAAVVVFFATTCPFCRRHNEHVEKLARATRGQPLRVLGVAADRDPEVVRAYRREKGYRYDMTLDDEAMHAALSWRRVIPLTCVVDRDGRLREVIAGEMFEEDVLELARWAGPA